MKKAWAIVGRILYVLAWPGLYFYLKDSHRSRIIVRSGDKILVVKDWLGNGKWKLPGGGIHDGEKPIDSARRELFEETGLGIGVEQLKENGSIEARGCGAKIYLHIFSLNLSAPALVKKQKLEIIDSNWQSIAELIKKKNISINTLSILDKFK